MLHKTSNMIFLNIFPPWQSQSLSSLFNILPPSTIYLLATSDVENILLIFLMFRV